MIESINTLLGPLEKLLTKYTPQLKIVLLGISILVLPLIFVPSFQRETGEQALNVLWVILFLPIFARVIGLSLAMTLMSLRKELGILMGVLAWVHGAGYIIEYPTWILDPLFWWNNGLVSYFAVGLISLILTTPLLLTSNEWAIRKLGKWWKVLHRLVYLVAIFTVAHVVLITWFNQGMIDYTSPAILGIYFIGKILEWRGLSLVKKKLYPKGQKFRCIPCGFIYDPALGDIDGGIPAGTEFADIPDSWRCPQCGVTKSDFVPYEEGEDIKTTSAKIVEVTLLNPSTVELIVETEKSLQSLPGQFMLFLMNDAEGDFTRSYSIVTTNGKRFTFTIKLSELGRGAKILRSFKKGSAIEVIGIFGNFTLKMTKERKIFIATGTGLAPIYRMIEATEGTDNSLYFSVSTKDELFYREKLEAIPDLDLHIHITKEEVEGCKSGRVDTDLIEAAPDTEWYLCGNPRMVTEAREKLTKRGFTNVYSEEFL